jgi:hypothetical protein
MPIFVPFYRKTPRIAWFVWATFEGLIWIFGGLFLSGKIETLCGLSDGEAKLVYLGILSLYFPYAIATSLRFGMTVFPRFVGKVALTPIDGASLSTRHVIRFQMALAGEWTFVVMTGGLGFFYLLWDAKKRGGLLFHHRYSFTHLRWVVGSRPDRQTERHVLYLRGSAPRSAVAKAIRRWTKK